MYKAQLFSGDPTKMNPGSLQSEVLDSDGNSFTVRNRILNSESRAFIVNTRVLDSDGNAFTIFS
jgi:hypothetical protein